MMVCINNGEFFEDGRLSKKSVNLINNKMYKVIRVVEGNFEIKNEIDVTAIYDRRRFMQVDKWRDGRINNILDEVSL